MKLMNVKSDIHDLFVLIFPKYKSLSNHIYMLGCFEGRPGSLEGHWDYPYKRPYLFTSRGKRCLEIYALESF